MEVEFMKSYGGSVAGMITIGAFYLVYKIFARCHHTQCALDSGCLKMSMSEDDKLSITTTLREDIRKQIMEDLQLTEINISSAVSPPEHSQI